MNNSLMISKEEYENLTMVVASYKIVLDRLVAVNTQINADPSIKDYYERYFKAIEFIKQSSIVNPDKQCVCHSKKREVTWDNLEIIIEVDGGESSYTSLDIVKNPNNNKFYIRGHGEGEAVLEITYCPLCGSRLT